MLKALNISEVFHPSVEFISSLGTILVVGFGGYLAFRESLSVADKQELFLTRDEKHPRMINIFNSRKGSTQIMKKWQLLFLVFVMCLTAGMALADVNLDETMFPDSGFRSYLDDYDVNAAL